MGEESDLIQREGDSKIYSERQTYQGSLGSLSFSLPFHMPLLSHRLYTQTLHSIWANRSSKHSQTHKRSPQRSLWRGSVCICPSAPLLAAMAGQSLLASAGNSPEPYTIYLNTHTHTQNFITETPQSLTGYNMNTHSHPKVAMYT